MNFDDVMSSLIDERDSLRGRVEELEGMIREVYRQCGNHAPAERRHALTPAIRDQMRDYLYPDAAHLRNLADAEDAAGSTSVGGLAADLGQLGKETT